MDQIIETVNKINRFLRSEQDGPAQDLYVLLDENKLCSDSLKELNEGLNFLIRKYRRDLSKEQPQPPTAKQLAEKNLKSSVVYNNEFQSNERLIHYLSLELSRLTSESTNVDNPA